MASFDSLQPLAFGNYRIPFEEYEITFEGRVHIHEYPHAQGGAPEKLGRKLALFHVEGRIDTQLIGPQYENNWPDTSNFLRFMAQSQDTDVLTIPTVGMIPAFIHVYKEKRKNTQLSGFNISLDFIEDTSEIFIADQIAQLNTNALSSAMSDYQLQLLKNTLTMTKEEMDLFDLIGKLASDIQGLRDQFQLYSSLVQAKFNGLFSALNKAYATSKWLCSPANILGLEAFHALWEAARLAYTDQQSKAASLLVYTTVRDETLQQVSNDIFGDSSHASDLLGLNALSDPFRIPAGTQIKYYAAA